VLVPVPLHPRRLRARGYNQAAVIAAAIARRTGLEVADCLLRSGSAATQVGRHRAERRTGLAGSISVEAGRIPGPARELSVPAAARALSGPAAACVLVDDVATTGATLAACAAALVEAGCGQVTAITFARTIGR
jgi:predicted amidophosphoribosyltransferase